MIYTVQRTREREREREKERERGRKVRKSPCHGLILIKSNRYKNNTMEAYKKALQVLF